MKIEWVDQRLQRWAAWSLRGGLSKGLWYARCSLAAEGGGAGNGDDVQLNQEAERTQRALVQLNPPELRQAVMAYYCGRGTRAQRAKDCGCSEATMMRRLHHAHERLVGLFPVVDERPRQWPVRSCLAQPVDL